MGMPQVSTAVLIKAFIRLGFIELNRNNSHIKVSDPNDPSRYAAIPNHKGAKVAPGTLRNILKSTKVEVKELMKVL